MANQNGCPIFPPCAALKAQGIDSEAHEHLLAVLVGAVSRLPGGPEALRAASEQIEIREEAFASLRPDDPTLLMTADFLDAWGVRKD